MKRRTFLKTATRSALGLPVFVNGFGVSVWHQYSPFGLLEENDHVLVLVQLKGGNDGLNTLIPLDQYRQLVHHRSNVLIPENRILKLNEKQGLHPAMTSVEEMYKEGKISFVQGVGYPNQNRSHFRSTDIWTSASSAEVVETSGWAGRYFNLTHPDFPTDYPNDDYPDPFALTIGRAVSTTCQGPSGNFSLAITDPFSISPLTEPEEGHIPDGYYGDQLSFLRTAINQTNEYGNVLRAAGEKGKNIADYPADNRFAQQLKTVAQLISGGLKTKIYVVSLGGFDTHGNQVEAGDPAQGEHAVLLQTLSDAIRAFQSDLQQLGLEERVLGVSFSEFGRRIKSNGSRGTDHGSAAPMILFGSCVNSGILGDNPEIPAEVDHKEGVAMQYDFRSVYSTLLQEWLGVGEDSVRELLFGDFTRLPLLACAATATTYLPENRLQIRVYPNPITDNSTLSFSSEGEHIRISLFDGFGHEIRLLANKAFPRGVHELNISFQDLPNGNYYYRLLTPVNAYTKAVIRMK